MEISSILRLHPDEKLRLDEQDSIVLDSNLTLPKTIFELPTKSYGDSILNDPSIIKNTTLVDFRDKILDNVRFVTINSPPAVREHFTPTFYVDEANYHRVHESSVLRLDPNENLELVEKESKTPNSTLTSPKTIKELPTKSYVDSSHENSRNRRAVSSKFNDQMMNLIIIN